MEVGVDYRQSIDIVHRQRRDGAILGADRQVGGDGTRVRGQIAIG